MVVVLRLHITFVMTNNQARSVWWVQVRVPGEHVKPHEVHFKLHPAELPVKNKVNFHTDKLLWKCATFVLEWHSGS